jgi:hypothetical protein
MNNKPHFSSAWFAVGREADLATQLVGSGITALGRAHHAQTGLYSQALFGLAIGLERFAKLIVIADYAIHNSGGFPKNKELRHLGHKLAELLDTCEQLSLAYKPLNDRLIASYWDRPRDPINAAIVNVLSDFAISTRYYNLDHISDTSGPSREPVATWWSHVGEPILKKHYAAERRAEDKRLADTLGKKMDEVAITRFFSEEGDLINDFGSLMLRRQKTGVVQRYGRMYTLQVVRWLVALLICLSEKATESDETDAFFGLNERIWTFIQPDKALRDKKTWP